MAGRRSPRTVHAPPLRQLPSVDEVLRRPEVQTLCRAHGRVLVTRAIRQTLEEGRKALRTGGKWQFEVALLVAVLHRMEQPSLRPVINATGVVLHTNLGRAPWADAAWQAARDVVAGYCNLEFELGDGRRGNRHAHAANVVAEMLGTEDALVVNNGAAAVLLVLSALSAGRETVVSRGELIEIGGGFRVPEVISQGGARLREVGTTNKTRVQDYERAITAESALLLKVHPSNFAQAGFVETTSLQELVALGRSRGLPVVVDLGTGLLERLPGSDEPTAAEVMGAGADLVVFSGDKLLGGPQAGILAGSASLVEACRRHPLCRALRVDKATLAALEATLRLHRDGRQQEIPTHAMMCADVGELKARAEHLAARLTQGGVAARAETVFSRPGGGTLPTMELGSAGVLVKAGSAERMLAALREQEPPVVARVEGGHVVLDLRTVPAGQDALLLTAVRAAWRAAGPAHAQERPC